MTIFEKYNLEVIKENESIYLITHTKENRILSYFLDYWNRSDEIIDDFLPELDPVIEGELQYNDIGADVIGSAYFEREKTEFTSSELGFDDLEIPTNDFKELIMEWLSVLEKEGY